MAKRKRSGRVMLPLDLRDQEAAPEVPVVPVGLPTERSGAMTIHEASDIVRGSCDRKQRYQGKHQAMRMAAYMTVHEGQRVVPYLCPFSSHRGGKHWHVGHPPTIERMERLALAVRFWQQHPDQMPEPRLRWPGGQEQQDPTST